MAGPFLGRQRGEKPNKTSIEKGLTEDESNIYVFDVCDSLDGRWEEGNDEMKGKMNEVLLLLGGRWRDGRGMWSENGESVCERGQ